MKEPAPPCCGMKRRRSGCGHWRLRSRGCGAGSDAALDWFSRVTASRHGETAMFRNLSRSRKLIVLGTLLSLVFAYPSVSEAQKNKKKKKPPAQQGGGDQGGQPGGGQTPPAQEPPPSEVYTVDRQLWEHKTGEARGTIVKVADKAGSNGAVALAMGRVLEQEKKYGESESHLRKATELSPSDPAAFVYLGETLLRARTGGDAAPALPRARGRGRSARR